MQLGINFSDTHNSNLLPGDGEALLYSQLVGDSADVYFKELLETIQWEEEEITMFGKRMKVPRLIAWHGDADASYTYSGVKHDPHPWTPLLSEIRVRVENQSSCKYNSVLLNLYRDGSDSMGWHSDDEPELGENPVIASVSFGQERKFHFRHKQKKYDSVKLELGHGSLLVMKGETQHHWQHQVPKSKKILKPRINLTFRMVK